MRFRPGSTKEICHSGRPARAAVVFLAVFLFCAPLFAKVFSVDSVWYDKYGLVYAGFDEGIKPGGEYPVTRNETIVGTFKIIDVQRDYSKGVLNTENSAVRLQEGDNIMVPSAAESSEAANPPVSESTALSVEGTGRSPFLPFIRSDAEGAVVTEYTNLGNLIQGGNVKVSAAMSDYGLAFRVKNDIDVAVRRMQMELAFPYNETESYGINTFNVRYHFSNLKFFNDKVSPSVGYMLWDIAALDPQARNRVSTVYATLDRSSYRLSTFAGLQASFGEGGFDNQMGVHAGVAYRLRNSMDLFVEYSSLDLLKNGVINTLAPHANLGLVDRGFSTQVACVGCRDDSLSLGINYQPKPNIVIHAGIYDVVDLRSPSAGLTVSF